MAVRFDLCTSWTQRSFCWVCGSPVLFFMPGPFFLKQTFVEFWIIPVTMTTKEVQSAEERMSNVTVMATVTAKLTTLTIKTPTARHATRVRKRVDTVIILNWMGKQVCDKWASSSENLFIPYANNKGADQAAHPRSLISAFVVRLLDRIIPILATNKISRL